MEKPQMLLSKWFSFWGVKSKTVQQHFVTIDVAAIAMHAVITKPACVMFYDSSQMNF